MTQLADRFVLVPAGRFDDLLELARLAAEARGDDQLALSLRAAIAEIRCSTILEP